MQAISWRDRQAIEDWVTRMATAEFDPAITFSSIDVVSDPEKCSAKVRFKGTSEAILFLIRKERREGKLIKQLPYPCDLCKGFHNTHLIERSTLNKLVLKYQPRTKKRKTDQDKTALTINAQPPQTWKNSNLEVLLENLVRTLSTYLSKNFGITTARVKNFNQCLDLIGYPSAFQLEPDLVELKILWSLFYALQYKDVLKNQVEPHMLISETESIGKNAIDNFQKRVIMKYFFGQSLFDGLCHVAEKCAGIKKYDWVRLNSNASLLNKHSWSLKLQTVGAHGSIKIDAFITKANCTFETNGNFDKIVAEYSLDSKSIDEEWKPIRINSKYVNEEGELHVFELNGLRASSKYLLKLEYVQLNGNILQRLENFKTQRMPDAPKRIPSDSGRNTWPIEALPPGGGALRRRNGN